MGNCSALNLERVFLSIWSWSLIWLFSAFYTDITFIWSQNSICKSMLSPTLTWKIFLMQIYYWYGTLHIIMIYILFYKFSDERKNVWFHLFTYLFIILHSEYITCFPFCDNYRTRSWTDMKTTPLWKYNVPALIH